MKPDRYLTIVLLKDALSAEALEDVRANLLALYGQLHGRPIRLMVLHDDTLENPGSLQSRAQLVRLLANSQAPDKVADRLSMLDGIFVHAAQYGSRWSSVLFVGSLPTLDESTLSYAQALLARTFSNQQVRAFLLSPSEEDPGWASAFEATGGGVFRR